MKENNISADDIKKVIIKTFKRATMLSKIEPQTADEAQYNIAYPVATSIVYGDFGINHVQEESLKDEKLDAEVPAKSICRAEIYTTDGKLYISDECEPRGKAHENIDIQWLSEKFRRITSSIISKEHQNRILNTITGDENISVRDIVDTTKNLI